LSAAPQGRTARPILDLGHADAESAAVARHLAGGILSQVEALLPIRSPICPRICAMRWPGWPAC
jgi:hypothetical protein